MSHGITPSRLVYPIAIEPGDEQHAFGVVVPDLPGCFSAADSFEEVLSHAREAIQVHLELLVEMGGDIPPRRPLQEHRDNPDFAGWMWAVVEVEDPEEMMRSVRINVSLPERLLKHIDSHAAVRHMTRSGLLAEAARQWIGAG